jgi:hypothetical protein
MAKTARKGNGLMAKHKACERLACEKVAAGMALAVQIGREATTGGISRHQLWVSGAP